MSAKKTKDVKSTPRETKKVETTNHSWDGIEEYNNPLPKWWLYAFYACIAFSVLWWVLFPAWPLVHGATKGVLGYDSRAKVSEEIAKYDTLNEALNNALTQASYDEIAADPDMSGYAVNGGQALFATYCQQCHGAGAGGAISFPNLTDDDWIWGGSYDDIEYTLRHGVNDGTDPDTRISEMPAFQGQFDTAQLDALVGYVESLSGEAEGEFDQAQGETLFAENCASCHGETGQGDRAVGAPNLTDAIWLYSDDVDGAVIRQGILKGRKNAMPHWGNRFDDAQIKQLTYYVHQLGGGE